MKDQIIERLIEQGHIVIRCADRIINKREGYVQDIEDLHMDGNINTKESIILLKEDSSFNIPTMPYQTHRPDWTWDPNRPGTPMWEVTCSNDLSNTI